MAVSFVQSASAASTASVTSIAKSFTSSVTTGNMLVVVVVGAGTTIGLTDNHSNTYTQAGTTAIGGTGGFGQANNQAIFFLNVAPGASFTLTGTSSTSGPMSIAIHEYSGVYGGVDVYNTGTAGTTSGSITTTQPGDLIFATISDDGSGSTPAYTAGTGYTLREANGNSDFGCSIGTEDQVQTSAGAITASFGGAGGGRTTVCIVALKAGNFTVFGDTGSYTNKSTSTAAAKIAGKFAPSTTGVVQSLSILLDMFAGTTTARGVIYADSAGSPGALLAVSDAQTISGSTLTRYTFNFTGANQIQVNSGTNYWIGAYWQTPSGSGTIEWGRGTTASAADKSTDTATGPATTFGTVSAISGPLGVYVTYNDTLSITSHYVKKIGSVAGNSVSSIQVAGPTTTGDTITVGVTWYTGSGSYPTCAITDSKGNTYTVLSSYTGSSTTGPSHLVAIATGTTALTSGDHITATFTGTAPFSIMGADEWGSTVSATLDGSVVQGNVTSASTAVSFSGYSNTNVSDLVLVYIGSFGNLTATAWPNAFTTNAEFQSSAPTLSWSWAQTADATSFSDRATLSASEIYAYSIIGLKAPSAGGTTYTQALTAGSSFTGGFGPTTTNKVMAAALSFTGAYTRFISYVIAATASFTGSVKKFIAHGTFTGGLSFAGTLSTGHLFSKALAAGLSFLGGSSEFAFVQSKQAAASGTSLTITPATAFTQGNLVIVNIKSLAVLSSLSVTDSAGNTYALAVGPFAGQFNNYQYYGVQITGGATSVTLSWSNSTSVRATVDEFSGNMPSNATVFDKTATGHAAGQTSPATASVTLTPTYAGELISAMVNPSGATSMTPGAGYSGGTIGNSGSTEYNLNGTTAETAPMTITNSTTIAWDEVAGAYIPQGAVLKQTNKILSAGLLFAGSMVRTITRGLSAGTSFAGTLLKTSAKRVAGTLSSTGNISKTTHHSQTASVGFTGTVKRNISHGLTASLSLTGSIGRAIAHGLTAGLSFVGNLLTNYIHGGGTLYTQALTGGLSFAGSQSRAISKSMTAGLSFVGASLRAIRRGFTATVSFTGSTLRRSLKALAGAGLSFTGSVARLLTHHKILSAGLSFTGAMGGRNIFKVFVAGVSFEGGMKLYSTAVITFLWELAKSATHLGWLTPLSGGRSVGTGSAPTGSGKFVKRTDSGAAFGPGSEPGGPGFSDVTPQND